MVLAGVPPRGKAIEVHLTDDGKIDDARLVEAGSRRTEGWRRYAATNPTETFLRLILDHGFVSQTMAHTVACLLRLKVKG